MLIHLLSVAVVLLAGLVAGVFFDVALAMLPAFIAMPADRFVEANNMIGKGYHPTMPIVCSAAVLLNLWLVFLASTPTRYLFLAATVLVLGTQFISEFGNMRINRRLLKQDPENLPADWQDPRAVWRAFHLLRTALALLALILDGFAVALAG